MTLLEDINSGKYNLILILILFVLVFQIHWSKSTEHMADVSSDIKETIKQIYNADVEAIRNLSEVATKLQAGGLTIPGNLRVTGNMAVEGGNFNLGDKDKDQWIFHAPADDRGGLWISRVQRDGNVNWGNGIGLLTSADGTQNLGGNFNIVPRGTIVSWTGSTAPAGWVLCDGANGTPDLRGRFVLGSGQTASMDNSYTGFGAKSYERSYNFPVNETGGENNHNLDINEIPAHGHPYTDSWFSEAWGNDPSRGTGLPGSGDTDNDNRLYTMFDKTTSNIGGSQPHNNMPPYYVLAYIMKL